MSMYLILHSLPELRLKNPADYCVKSYTHLNRQTLQMHASFFSKLSFLHNRQHAVLNQLLLLFFYKRID